jgi:hypothetical protein
MIVPIVITISILVITISFIKLYGGGTAETRAATSPDGINWSFNSPAASTNNWGSVTYSPELNLLCGVGYSPSTTSAMTTPH